MRFFLSKYHEEELFHMSTNFTGIPADAQQRMGMEFLENSSKIKQKSHNPSRDQRVKRSFEQMHNPKEGSPVEKKVMVSILFKEDPKLNLPSQVITKKMFLNCSVFENVKDKERVYSELVDLIKTDSFQKEYESFLSNLAKENWFEYIQQDPEKMAQFSFLAYLEGNHIDREELFVINIVAEGYQELKNKYKEGEIGKVIDVKPRTLSSQEVANYLHKAGFPPFVENTDPYPYIITIRKDPEELEGIKTQIIEDFKKRSPIQRTVLEYTLSRFQCYNDALKDSIEMRIHYEIKSRLGFLDTKQEQERTMVLLPPEFAIELFRKVSFNPSRSSSEHCLSFGYKDDNTKFFEGIRVITIPSPACEALPPVHHLKNGPKGLGILFHDINYHIPVEINNPHSSFFVEITKQLRSQVDLLTTGSFYFDLTQRMVNRLVDREIDYRRGPLEKLFWVNLNSHALRAWEQNKSIAPNQFIDWYGLIYVPVINRVLQAAEDHATAQKILSNTWKMNEAFLLNLPKKFK